MEGSSTISECMHYIFLRAHWIYLAQFFIIRIHSQLQIPCSSTHTTHHLVPQSHSPLKITTNTTSHWGRLVIPIWLSTCLGKMFSPLGVHQSAKNLLLNLAPLTSQPPSLPTHHPPPPCTTSLPPTFSLFASFLLLSLSLSLPSTTDTSCLRMKSHVFKTNLFINNNENN